MTMTLKPVPLLTPIACPVCRHGIVTPEAIKLHNIRCALTGERSYRWR